MPEDIVPFLHRANEQEEEDIESLVNGIGALVTEYLLTDKDHDHKCNMIISALTHVIASFAQNMGRGEMRYQIIDTIYHTAVAHLKMLDTGSYK